MPDRREIQSFQRAIIGSVTRIMDCIEGLPHESLNRRPPAEGANSLYVLAVHTMANVEENILGVLCGQPVERDRDAEFLATGESAAALLGAWRLLRERIEAAMAELPPSELEREREHPRRGRLNGREALLQTARHAAEHAGQAELTRDLLRAAKDADTGETIGRL